MPFLIDSTPVTSGTTHLVILVGHQKHVNALLGSITQALEEHKEVSVSITIPKNTAEIEEIYERFGGNVSIFVIDTDVPAFASRHHMTALERKNFEMEVSKCAKDRATFVDLAKSKFNRRIVHIKGSRREIAQVRYIAHMVERFLGRKARPVS